MKLALPAAGLALLWLAMLLAGGADSAFDPAILDRLYAGNHPALAVGGRVLTELGGWRVLTFFTLGAMATLLLQRRHRPALLLAGIVLLGRLAVELQKLAVARLRPDLHEPLVPAVSASFPSGHAANSAITYLAIAWLLGRRPGWLAAAALATLGIGASRILLGVHWPSDVIGGWSFALLWLALWLGFAGNDQRPFRHRSREGE